MSGLTAKSRWLVVAAIAAAAVSIAFTGLDQFDFVAHGVSRGQVPGRDFANTWTGARLMLDGRVASIFDPPAYAAALKAAWPSLTALQSYSYPPSILPLTAWLGALPYPVALAAWSALGLVAMLLSAWPVSRDPRVALALATSPAALMCLAMGQTGLVTSALLVGGLRLSNSRPWLAGLIIGLATFKPQLGILVPVALLAAGRWRTVAGAAASAAGLAAIALAMTGPAGWWLYVARTVPYQGVIFRASHGLWLAMTPSPLATALTAGIGGTLAASLQIIATIASACIVAALFRRRRQAPISAMDLAVLFGLSAIAAPYSFNYDLPGLTVALLLVALQQPEQRDIQTRRIGGFVLWSAPITMVLAWAAIKTWIHADVVCGSYVVLAGVALFLWPTPHRRGALST